MHVEHIFHVFMARILHLAQEHLTNGMDLGVSLHKLCSELFTSVAFATYI